MAMQEAQASGCMLIATRVRGDPGERRREPRSPCSGSRRDALAGPSWSCRHPGRWHEWQAAGRRWVEDPLLRRRDRAAAGRTVSAGRGYGRRRPSSRPHRSSSRERRTTQEEHAAAPDRAQREVARPRVAPAPAQVLDGASFAFLGLCFYMFIEYVRPQSVWRSLDVLPWGQVALALPIIGMLFDKAKPRPFILLDGLLILFTAILFASFTVAFDVSASFDQLKTFINWMIFYYLATRLVSTGPRFLLPPLVHAVELQDVAVRGPCVRHARVRVRELGDRREARGGSTTPASSRSRCASSCPSRCTSSWGFAIAGRSGRRTRCSRSCRARPSSTLIASSSRGGQLGAAAVLSSSWRRASTG